MISKELLYKNSLDLIEHIYNESMYNSDVLLSDLYRIYDIINSINNSQMSSKQWLVDTLVPILTAKSNYTYNGNEYIRDDKLKDILILGSWYGLTSILLKELLDPSIKIWNVDSDPVCEIIGRGLQKNIDNCEENRFATSDAVDYFLDRTDSYQVIINSSCEHMEQEDIDIILNTKGPNTLVCFQSNNYHDEPEHINTHNSLDDFVKSLNLVRVFWSGTLKPTDAKYERYMVIGI